MTDLVIAIVFLGMVTYPALAALTPSFEMDDETRRSLAPAMASGHEAFGPGEETASLPSH